MIKHTFLTTSHDITGLFKNVNKMSSFMKNLEKQSRMDPLRYTSTKYCGDGFEFFCECFLKLFHSDNRVGLYQYEPVPSHEDTGLDGIGVNINLEPSVAQIKYKSNTTTSLTANEDRLSNMFVAAMVKHGITTDMSNKKNYRHFIFSTAKSLHHFTKDTMFEGKVHFFGIDQFTKMVDNNFVFWNNLRNLIQDSLKKIESISHGIVETEGNK
jgi:hypothetical protein